MLRKENGSSLNPIRTWFLRLLLTIIKPEIFFISSLLLRKNIMWVIMDDNLTSVISKDSLHWCVNFLNSLAFCLKHLKGLGSHSAGATRSSLKLYLVITSERHLKKHTLGNWFLWRSAGGRPSHPTIISYSSSNYLLWQNRREPVVMVIFSDGQ